VSLFASPLFGAALSIIGATPSLSSMIDEIIVKLELKVEELEEDVVLEIAGIEAGIDDEEELDDVDELDEFVELSSDELVIIELELSVSEEEELEATGIGVKLVGTI
jgi:hypothetical protein